MPLTPFTPYQQKIFDLLCDGLLHTRDEIVSIFEPAGQTDVTRDTAWKAAHQLIKNMRPALRERGLDVIPQTIGTATRYRMIRPINREEISG